MFFYDTCSLLNNYNAIFKDVASSPFVMSNISLMELEEIKSSRHKDDEIKFKAKKLSQLLNFYYGQYTIVNYEKDWDSIYIEPNPILLDNNDSKIVVSAYAYAENHPDIIFVTDDINCNNIAKSLGLTTNNLISKVNQLYTGYKTEVCVTDEEIAEFYNRLYEGDTFDLLSNQYLILKRESEVIDSYVYRNNKLEQIQFNTFKSKMFGEVKPIDPYQKLAFDSLKHNQLTMLRGKAGAGKSLLSCSYLFSQLEEGKIDHIIIFCNTVATDGAAKLGYYPGSRTEKLLDSQIGNFLTSKLGDRVAVERLLSEGQLLLLPMSDLRGFDTTGMRAGVYITEAQNLDINLMKVCLQRLGEDCFCILDGDTKAQVDLKMYAGANNGMCRVSQIYRGQDFFGEITLPIGHRSKIANLAEEL